VATAVHEHTCYSLYSIQCSTLPPTSATRSAIGRDELCKIAAHNMHHIRRVYCQQVD